MCYSRHATYNKYSHFSQANATWLFKKELHSRRPAPLRTDRNLILKNKKRIQHSSELNSPY
jgi:hypothetical protein